MLWRQRIAKPHILLFVYILLRVKQRLEDGDFCRLQLIVRQRTARFLIDDFRIDQFLIRQVMQILSRRDARNTDAHCKFRRRKRDSLPGDNLFRDT